MTDKTEATTETVEATATTEATETATVKRDPVSNEDFLRAYIPGQAAGQSAKEIAETLNMDPGTFNVKKAQLTKKMRFGLATFLDGKTEIEGEALSKRIKVPINDFKFSADKKSVEAWKKSPKDKDGNKPDNKLVGTFKIVKLGYELKKLAGSGREVKPASELAELAELLSK